MLKRFVFAILIIWALADALISAKQAPSFSIGIALFLGSLFWSGLFILLVAIVWNWTAHRLRRDQKSD